MFSYVLRRLLATLPVMLFVALFVFGLLDLAPGDPAALLAGEDATAQDIARIRATLGLDQPFLLRFGHWIWAVLHGDLGTSLFTSQPVTYMIGQRLAPTFSLMVMTLILSVLVAVPLGALAAWRHNAWQDRGIMVGAVLGFSVPSFVVGYLLAWTLGLQLRWFPVQGYAPLSRGLWTSLHTLVLPALALGSVYIALITRITRATLLETLSQDYVRTARAKGVHDRTLLFRHALKNAAVPILTVIGSGVALLISGTVITETVFSIPGLGRLTVDAILRRDYPVIQGVILLFSFMYVLINLAVDLLYRVFDPRIKILMRAFIRMMREHPTIALGGLLLLLLILIAVCAPWLHTVDPTALSPVNRTRPPSERFWFGTDLLGRDVYSRVIYGARVSLIVGFTVAILSTVAGVAIGLAAGFVRWIDAVAMRIMDGFMSIPTILLAIALISLSRASLHNVIFAITLAEIPRVVRLVRGVVLSLREQPFVESAVAAGASRLRVVLRHILPNTIAPLTVQATYICGVAILAEAGLSFIGAGVPPATPSWGNIMAEGRALWQIKPYLIAFPAIFLSATILAINMLGDGLRDAIDPRMAKRI